MKSLFVSLLSSLALVALTGTVSQAEDSRVYEMRTYFSPPGKLEDLNARFRNHTVKLFEKHGIQNIGYFVPVDNKDNKLVYFLAYPSREAAAKSWKEFAADPDWFSSIW